MRSYIHSLVEKGYLIRTRGGAHLAFHPAILKRQKHRFEIKQSIAKAAADLIGNGDSIMVEAGTTTALIGRYLLGKQNIKVVTDSTLLLPYARSNPSLHLSFTGGSFQPEAESMTGPMAVAHLEQFHAKSAFIGTDGFSIENGLTAYMMEAADVVRAMCKRSERSILLADSSKWNRTGFARIIPLGDINILITDEGFPYEARKKLKKLGVGLIITSSKEEK
ncbi:MAG: hypothetical protein B6D68_02090 [spirochete symbiont of Stewartia floridana]|nr:MAG: hypothetical protein B6D68_02090 [spirochete symbiont of Stewartia floridana]